jgi:drug/metabolite transporter (DMT)-like permease
MTQARERTYGDLAALAAVLIWALVPVGTRFFVLRVDPQVFNVVRYLAAALTALPLFARARPWRWPRRDQHLMVWCALLAIPGYNLPVAIGARAVTAGQLGLLIATEPVFIIALALLLEGRRIHARLIAGCLLALAGVALTSGVLRTSATLRLTGALEVLAGALCWSLYTVLVARLYRRQGALGVTGATVVVGTVLLVLVSYPLMRGAAWPSGQVVLELGAMGIASSMIGFLCWNYAGSHVPAERLGLFLYFIPVGSVATGALLLNEALTTTLVAGGALTLFGVWLATHSGSRMLAAAAEP